MTSIILSGLKRLNELGSWRALRAVYVFWQRTETKRSYFSLQQLVLGDDTEAITSKITPARILKAKSLFEMERFEHQRERTLLFSQLPLPSFSRNHMIYSWWQQNNTITKTGSTNFN